jgi:hypothetical protein
MNIQIDTNTKTLKLQESVNLGEFSEILLKLFPNNEWKEYKLETNTVINNWSSPIIIDRYNPYPRWNVNPIIGGTYISSNGSEYVGDLPGTFGKSVTDVFDFKHGVYNVSIN